MLSEFLHSFKSIFINNRFLGVGYDLPFFFRKMDGFLNLEADKGAFEINGASRVLSVFKNMPKRYLIPTIRIIRSLVCCLSADTIPRKQKSPVGNAEITALPTGRLLYSKIGTFDLAFVFT